MIKASNEEICVEFWRKNNTTQPWFTYLQIAGKY